MYKVLRRVQCLTNLISILKSLVTLLILLALIGASYSRIAPFYALKSTFFPANETVLLKHNNQSDFKACLKEPITLQENGRLFFYKSKPAQDWINKILRQT